MIPTSKLDTSGLDRAISRLIPFTEKTGPEIVNQRLLNVAGRAANKTPMADKTQIISELGEVGRKIRVTKKGKLVRGNRVYAQSTRKDAPLAALIINSRRKKSGKPGLYGKQMASAIKRMVGGRTRSAGFERSGYIPGIKRLASTLKKPFIIGQIKGISVRGQPKGKAIPAPAKSLRPSAILENKVKAITKVGGQAMQDALNEEGREIVRHVEEQMAPGIRQFNSTR